MAVCCREVDHLLEAFADHGFDSHETFHLGNGVSGYGSCKVRSDDFETIHLLRLDGMTEAESGLVGSKPLPVERVCESEGRGLPIWVGKVAKVKERRKEGRKEGNKEGQVVGNVRESGVIQCRLSKVRLRMKAITYNLSLQIPHYAHALDLVTLTAEQMDYPSWVEEELERNLRG